MVRESRRKCSHCGLNGHNSRTCGNLGKGNNNNYNNNYNCSCVKLFGVNLMENRDESSNYYMRKSSSMGNLNIIHHAAFDLNNNATAAVTAAADDGGYLSDGLIHNKKRKAAHDRKKGKAWTEEEHRTFLAGLKKLGKGDWRGISKRYVTTRTPTQVASHAQKYFLRKNMNVNANQYHNNKKRRASLFDIPPQIKNNNVSQECQASSSAIKETSQILLSKNSIENQQQVSNLPRQLINRFPHLCLDTPHFVHPQTGSQPSAVPNLLALPKMVGVSPNVQVGRRSSKSPRSSPNYEPMASHPSGIPPSPRSLNLSSSVIEASSFGTDALDLKIGLPQSPHPKNLSSQTNSSAIRVI